MKPKFVLPFTAILPPQAGLAADNVPPVALPVAFQTLDTLLGHGTLTDQLFTPTETTFLTSTLSPRPVPPPHSEAVNLSLTAAPFDGAVGEAVVDGEDVVAVAEGDADDVVGDGDGDAEDEVGDGDADELVGDGDAVLVPPINTSLHDTNASCESLRCQTV